MMALKMDRKWSPFWFLDNLYGFFLGFWYAGLMMARNGAENGYLCSL